MRSKITAALLSAMILGSMTLFPGCTPESPPLKPLLSSDEQSEGQTSDQPSDKESSDGKEPHTASTVSGQPSADSSQEQPSETQDPSDGSSDDDTSVSSGLSDESTDQESSDESGTDDESMIGKHIWGADKGELLEAAFRYERYVATGYYKSDDAEMMKRLAVALNNITVVSETTQSVIDDTAILILNTDRKNYMFEFEHGMLVYDGKNYILQGYERLQKVMDDIEAEYPEWKNKYDEWIHRMDEAQLRITEMTLGKSYKNADLEKRREIALRTLGALEKSGYIKAGSIDASGDTITFTYDCGDSEVQGAIMLREFDPMMN